MDFIYMLHLLFQVAVGFGGGYFLGLWRGIWKGHADFARRTLTSEDALKKFLQAEIVRKGGLDSLAKGIKTGQAYNSIIDEMFNRMDIMAMWSMVAEVAFYIVLLGYAFFGGAYLVVIGIPTCLISWRQAVKEKGTPQGRQMVLRLFALFHAWFKNEPVDAFSYAKGQKFPVQLLANLLRASGQYAL